MSDMESALGDFGVTPPPIPKVQTESKGAQALGELEKIIASVKREGKWAWVKNYWAERQRFYDEQFALLASKEAPDFNKMGQLAYVGHLVAREAESFINAVETTARERARRKSRPSAK